MSKSTLSITIAESAFQLAPSLATRTVEVPCRLPESFDFEFNASGSTIKAVAYLSAFEFPANAVVGDVEQVNGPDVECAELMQERADHVLATIKAALGISGPVPPGSPLPAIALAYEAEVAAYEAGLKAYREAPRTITGLVMYLPDPRDGESNACRLLAKYVEHVVENACKPQTERAESKVTP